MALSKVTKSLRDGLNVTFKMVWAKVSSAPSDALDADIVVPAHAMLDASEAIINPATSDLQTAISGKLDTLHTDLGTTLAGYLDGVEGKLDTLHTDLGTTLAGYLDGVEGPLGTQADGAWTSGNGTLIGLLKALVGQLVSGATAIAKAEDVASANADVGVPAMAIQKGTPADTAGTDGDYAMLQMSNGRLWVDASGKTLAMSAASGAIASGAVASGAFASGSIAAGAVAAGASSFVKLEDVASADADAGVPAMMVRKASPANTSGTDGDYEMLQGSAGRLWVDASGKTLTVDGSGVTQPVKATRSGTGTQSSVAGSASDGTILASNSNRLGATIFNDSSALLYLLLANATSSATVHTVQIAPGAFYEVPFNYTGVIKGIWASATGAARVTELT